MESNSPESQRRGKTSGGTPLLLIHPHNHAFPKVLPVGTIAALNLLPFPKLGRFAGEVRADEIAAAKIILVDVHWFLPLGVLDELLAGIRRANAVATIIAGGISASFYADLLLKRFPALDSIVCGHVEASLPALVSSLMTGETPPPIPGVHDKKGSSGEAPPPPPELFDRLDWLTVDWFPTYLAQVHAIHNAHPAGLDPHPYRNVYYPHLVATRGCHRRCYHCAGSHQDRVFDPKTPRRTPDGLLRDLERIERDPRLKFVTILFSDASYLPPFASGLAGRGLELDAFLFFC